MISSNINLISQTSSDYKKYNSVSGRLQMIAEFIVFNKHTDRHLCYTSVANYVKLFFNMFSTQPKKYSLVFYSLKTPIHVAIKDNTTNKIIYEDNINKYDYVQTGVKLTEVPMTKLLSEIETLRKIKLNHQLETEQNLKTLDVKNTSIGYSIPEINLITKMQEINVEDDNDPLEIISNTKDALQNKTTKSFLYFLLKMLPKITHEYFDIKYNTTLEKKIWPNTKSYQTDFNAFVEYLTNNKIKNLTKFKNVFKTNVKPFTTDDYQLLIDILSLNKTKLRKILTLQNKEVVRYFSSLYRSYISEELPEKDLQYISINLSGIDDRNLIQLIKSMDTSLDVKKEFETILQEEQKYLKKIMKVTKLSANQMIEFNKEKPVQYKEWRKLNQLAKRFAKLTLEQEWNNLNYNIEPIAKAKALCKQLNIDCPIDKGFSGKVSLGTTQAMLFSFYTKDNKILDSVVGSTVVMNPKFKDNNNTYYCTHLPVISKTGVPIKVYTQEARNLSSQKLHNSAREINNVIEDVRTTMIADIVPIEKGKITFDTLRASVSRLIDLTAGRIGNKTSAEKRKNYGIHNLLCKHIKISSDKVTISYIGKKQVKQKHIVTDSQMIKVLTILTKNKKPSEYIFSKDGIKPINPNGISSYLTSIGFPGSPHRFRKYHANLIFNEIIEQKTSNKKIDVNKIFNLAVVEVSKVLGNTPAVCISAYIDPLLGKHLFDIYNTPYPKALANAINKIGSQYPDGDD